MRSRTLPFVLSCITSWLAFVHTASSQDVGKIQGRIIDEASKQPIANAQVVVLGTRLGNITNAEGFYFINNVPADRHDIQAQYIGYRTVTVQGQRVLAGQTITRDFQLRPAAVEIQALEIIGDRQPLVPRDQVASKIIVTGDAVDQLPIDNMLTLLRLQPGVVQTGRGNGISIRGGRAGEEAVFVDGVLVHNFNRGGSPLTIGTNTLAEVDVLTGGFSAQYGDAQSGIINYVTRSGGRRWNGTLMFATDELVSEHWSLGFNRAELAVGGPLHRNLSLFLAGSATGQKYADMPKTWRDFPFYVAEGVDTTITYNPGDGHLRTVSVPNFVRFDHGGHTPNSSSDEYTVDAKLDYTYGSGSRVFLTRKVSRNQGRANFGAGRVMLYSTGIKLGGDTAFTGFTGTLSRSQTTILGWTHNFVRSADRALALDVRIARQHDFVIQNSLLDADWDLAHRDPRFGFVFEDMQFVINEKNWPIDQQLLDRFTHNDVNGIVPFEHRSEFGSPSEFRLNPYATRTGFPTKGGNPGYANAEEWQWQYRAALDWQVNRQQRIKLGAEYFDIDTKRYVANSLTNRSFMQLWIENPKRQSAFIQDRLDLGDIVVEGGLRYDRFDPNSVFPILAGFYDPDDSPVNVAALQSVYPDRHITSTFAKARVRRALSPRLGVSFPVTVNSTVRLSYGHFTQLPDLRYYYWGKNKDFFRYKNTNTNDNFSAGGLDLGRTIAYEFGFRQLLGPDFVLDVAAYNRDKMRDVSNRMLAWPNPLTTNPESHEIKYLNTFVNADFGAIRGIDVRLDRRIGQVFDVMLGYSYQNAKNTGTDPFTYQNIFARLESRASSLLGLPPNPAQAMRLTEENRTHNITGSFSLQFPRSYHAAALRNTGLFGTFRRISGLPYSPMDRDQTAFLFVAGEAATTGPELRDDEINTARMPWQTYFDLKFSKGVSLNRMNASVFVDARNVLDLKVQTRTVLTTGDVTDENYYRLQVEAHRQMLGGGVMQDRVDLRSAAAAGAAAAPNPVDLYMLQQAEARFGNGDLIFTADEQARAFRAATVFALGPQDMFAAGRRIRLGIELAF